MAGQRRAPEGGNIAKLKEGDGKNPRNMPIYHFLLLLLRQRTPSSELSDIT